MMLGCILRISPQKLDLEETCQMDGVSERMLEWLQWSRGKNLEAVIHVRYTTHCFGHFPFNDFHHS